MADLPMPTPPQPVPWPEVADIEGDLFEWLAERGHVRMEVGKPKERPLSVATRMLGADAGDETPEDKSRARRVARALFDLELFRGGDRADAGRHKFPELEADRSLRGLQPTMRHIQRLVRKSQKPALQRMDQSDLLPEVKQQGREKLKAEYAAWNERLELMIGELAELHEKFLVLCPSVPQRPQTLSGWQALKKELKASLEGVDIAWSC